MSSPDLPLVNWPRLREALESQRIAAVIAATGPTVTYLSDFWSLSQWSRPQTAKVFAIAVADDDRTVHVVAPLGNTDLQRAPGHVPPTTVTAYGTFFASIADGVELDAEAAAFAASLAEPRGTDPVQTLCDRLVELGLASSRLAVEFDGMSASTVDRLLSALPSAELVDAGPLIRHVRAVKTPREITALRSAAQLTERAIMGAYAAGGATELDLVRTYLARIAAGAGIPVNTVICAGQRSALPNAQATDASLVHGDLIRFDGGCRVAHYVSDISRTAVVGSATAEQEDAYGAVLAGLDAAVAAASPGVRTADLFALAVDTTSAAGLPGYRRQHVGHGIGIENYDDPSLTPASDQVLTEGMVICIETPYYRLGWGGVQAEDTFLVTASGLERFTEMPRTLPEVQPR